VRLVAPDEVRENVRTFTEFVRGPGAGAPGGTLYFDSLNDVQRHGIRGQRGGAGPSLRFDLDDPAVAAILESLKQSPDLADVHVIGPVDPGRRDAIIADIASARELLRGHDPAWADLLATLVASLILVDADGYFGGSFWHILGTVWMSPRPSWRIVDYAENLLHETVHQAMFLDDMVNSLFAAPPDELASGEALVTSAIRGTKRPYDYAFHAATVSTELLRFYEQLGGLEQARGFCAGALSTLHELAGKERYLSPRGRVLLARMFDAVGACSSFAALRGEAGGVRL
jgi:HEXXH motif-containing protein